MENTEGCLAMTIYTKDYFNESLSKPGDQENASAVLHGRESERTDKVSIERLVI